MKLSLLTAFTLITFLSFSTDYYLPYKIVPGPNKMEFPIFENLDSTTAITKINTHLQMAELKRIAKSKNKRIFNTIHPLTDDFRIVDMDLSMKANNERVLSLRFDIAYSWQTMAYWSTFYNFNPQNGDLIQLEDLFTEDGYKKFKRRVFRKRSKDFAAYFNDSIPEYLDDIIDCYQRSSLEDFYIRNNMIYIESMNCFSKAQLFHGANTLYKFGLSSFQNDLNDYGQVLFGLKENIEHYHNYMASSLPALFTGTLGGRQVKLLLQSKNTYSDDITALYYYDAYRKCIELKGNLAGDYLKLIENNADEPDHKGTIMATITANKITGTWLGHNSGNFPIKLERY